MIKLGVSVYPEQESIEDIDNYLKLASSYGFTKVFSSMFSVKGTQSELIEYFTKLADVAHQYHMEVAIDANPELFNRVGATIQDLKLFQDIGIDTIRMDVPFGDERDVILINNQFGIRIELTALSTKGVENAIENGANVDNLTVCHNFYPQRFTGLDLNYFQRINNHWKNKGIKVAAFISSQVQESHGPWPVKDGLPTVEDHRLLPLDLQLRHMLALNNVDELLIGNSFASEDEFKSIKNVLDILAHYPQMESEHMAFLLTLAPHFGEKKVIIGIQSEKEISELERKSLFDFKMHADLGDGTSYMLRSRFTRGVKEDIPVRKCYKPYFTKGDIVMVNSHVPYYQGEVQIVLKDMENDGQRNLLGTIDKDEMILIDCIETGDFFSFQTK